MADREKKRAAKGGLRALFHSVEDGEFKGYCDIDHAISIDSFVRPYNDPFFMNMVTAIIVDDRGYCVKPMDVHADAGKLAVVERMLVCENEILSQHDEFDDAVAAAVEVIEAPYPSRQGLSDFAIIDDRGVVVWTSAFYYKQQKEETPAMAD